MADFRNAHKVVDKVAGGTNSIIDFLINNFNVDSGNINKVFDDSVRSLSMQAELPNVDPVIRASAFHLLDTIYESLGKLRDKPLLDKFTYMENEMELDVDKLKHVIRATDELVYDVKKAKDWLKEYDKHLKLMKRLRRVKVVDLEALGKAILGRAIELCPIRTGLLRKTGTVIVYEDKVEIVFLAPYATYVHEDLNMPHRYGQAKFLEQAAQEFIPTDSVWTETLGESIVYISIDNELRVNYRHFGG